MESIKVQEVDTTEHDGTMTDEVFQSMEESWHGTRYTKSQIEEHCLKLDKLCVLLNDSGGRVYFDSLQIIRQLQADSSSVDFNADRLDVFA